MLQWVHGRAAVVMGVSYAVMCAGLDASMGPRPRGRGDGSGRGLSARQSFCFNGSTAARPW